MFLLEPLLRWLEHDRLGHQFSISKSVCNTIVYTADIAVITDNMNDMQPQIDMLQQFVDG